MDEITKDNRFSHIIKDPRFKRIPKKEKKVKIDKRFQSMFNDKKFKVKYTVDKRGRPVDHTSSEDLKRYYAVSSDDSDTSQGDSDRDIEDQKKQTKSPFQEIDTVTSNVIKNTLKSKNDTVKNKSRLKSSFQEEDEKEDEDYSEAEVADDKDENDTLTDRVKKKLRDMKVDYARGEGVLLSESSSDEESTESDCEEELEHGWGELDQDAEQTDKATNRLAVCNMDWDKIRATDLMVLFNSFLPTGGVIHSISIYPSEFGLKRMKEEEIKGPIELTENGLNPASRETEENEEENEEGSKFDMEKLRQYQLNRLKYFYAIVECDCAETAEKLCNECDGLEYESSATKLDLRFVPDDTVFDQEPRESCDSLPDLAKYHPRYFTTTALQQAKVELTWDETNPERQELTKKLMSGQVDGVSEADLQAYLASSSSEESNDDSDKEESSERNDTASQGKEDALSKYRALLEEIKTKEEKKNSHDLEMEVTWGLDLKGKTEKLVKKKLQDSKNLTPFQQLLEKRKEKRKQKREERKKQLTQQDGSASDNGFSGDDIPSDIDMNDSYFKEEFEKMAKPKKGTRNEKAQNDGDIETTKRKKAELELLLMGESDTKHFSLKSILENECEKKKKKKKKKAKDETVAEIDDDFQMNVNDERFSALFSSHHFNIDPTDPHYHKTKAMEILRSEKLKRRNYNEHKGIDVEIPSKVQKKERDPELSILVKSVKRKAETLKRGTTR